ncbi:MAG: hypothetical protein R6X12_03920, partial [bacterium]
MLSMPKRVLLSIAVLFVAGTGLAATRVYFVEPKTATNGWTEADPNAYIGQTCTANVDSIAYIEWFVGELSAEGAYRFEIRDKATNALICLGEESVPVRGWQWVKCDSFYDGSRRFTKGREYLLKISHDAGDSVNYVYRADNPYKYGRIEVGGGGWGQSEPVEFCDLCARVVGKEDPTPSDWLGANLNLFRLTTGEGRAALGKAAGPCGLRWMRTGVTTWRYLDEDTAGVMAKCKMYADSGIELLGILGYGLAAHSTKPDTWTRKPLDSTLYPPCSLFAAVDGGQNPWAEYVREVMGRLPDVKYWCVWNEPNACSSYFGVPDTAAARGYKGCDPGGPLGDSWVDTPRERCSLYVRMCQVAKGVAETLKTGQKVVAGEVARVLDTCGGEGLTRGVDWLSDMLDLAESRYGGAGSCFDIVSVHPYQHVGAGATRSFSPAEFREDLAAVRAVMGARGLGGTELWATEVGWNKYLRDSTGYVPIEGATEERNADNLFEFFVSALAGEADPVGSYGRVFWWELSSRRDDPAEKMKDEGFGLLDSSESQALTYKAHACGHLSIELRGARLNGRVMTGDPDVDTLTRIYEFEDPGTGKRTWVGWKNGGTGGGDVEVRIPVRSDTVDTAALAYDPTQPSPAGKTCDTDGWLTQTLATRPVFITETGDTSRPDLVVDSVRVWPAEPQVSGPLVVSYSVRNHGTAGVPQQWSVNLHW